MRATSYERVADSVDIGGQGPFALSASGRDIVVVRTSEGLRAFDGRCPHQGALLGEGELDSGALVCRNHRWRFSVDTGQRVGGTECLVACPVLERDGAIYADLSGLPARLNLRDGKKSIDNLPGPKPLPVIGNLHQINPAKFHLVLENWAKVYGPIYRFKMGRLVTVVITDQKLSELILRARPETFRRQKLGETILAEMGIKGVFTAEGEAWRAQRKLSVAALSQRTLRGSYPKIRTVANRVKEKWRRLASTGQPIEIVEELKRFTVDVTSLIAFGHDANTVEESDDVIQQHLEVVLPSVNRRALALFPIWRYVRRPSDRRLERALGEIRAWLDKLISETRARLNLQASGSAEPSNFIEAMLTTVDSQGRPFPDETIFSNLITMLLAGEDTTAFTLAWAIDFLCDHPEWVQEIRREAEAVLGKSDTADDIEGANKLFAAGAVANEAMRLRPVAPLLLHDATEETVLGDYIIPRGVSVGVMTRPQALDDKNFADPYTFRPQRWLTSNDGPHEVSAHIPFGSGPRMCPGRMLALVEMKTLLAVLCKNFDIAREGDRSDVTELFGFTMSPKGLRIRLAPRTAQRAGTKPTILHDGFDAV